MRPHNTLREDERSLTGRPGTDHSPVHPITLHKFGIAPFPFLRQMAHSFDALPWDQYDVKSAQVQLLRHRFPDEAERLSHFLRVYFAGASGLENVGDLLKRLPTEDRRALEGIRPHRQRCMANFAVSYAAGRIASIERTANTSFSQQVGSGDCRALPRLFAEAPLEVTTDPAIRCLLEGVTALVNKVAAPRRAARLMFHQVRTVARRGAPGQAAPEGIHQDGADYIVSALVIEREGVIGGESTVYGPDRRTIYLRTVLQPGEGLFHADSGSPLWHGVSPVGLDPTSGRSEGKRSIIGFDIHLEP
jgi:2OG-Fe dioxygenase